MSTITFSDVYGDHLVIFRSIGKGAVMNEVTSGKVEEYCGGGRLIDFRCLGKDSVMDEVTWGNVEDYYNKGLIEAVLNYLDTHILTKDIRIYWNEFGRVFDESGKELPSLDLEPDSPCWDEYVKLIITGESDFFEEEESSVEKVETEDDTYDADD